MFHLAIGFQAFIFGFCCRGIWKACGMCGVIFIGTSCHAMSSEILCRAGLVIVELVQFTNGFLLLCQLFSHGLLLLL